MKLVGRFVLMAETARRAIWVGLVTLACLCHGCGKAPSASASPTDAQSTATAAPCQPADLTEIQIDLPWKAEANHAYPLHITYHIAKGERQLDLVKPQIRLFPDENGHVVYKPSSITVKRDEPAELTSVTMLETPSGLSQVRLNSPDLPAPTASVQLNIDLGFRGRVNWHENTTFESGRTTPIPLRIVDAEGRPLPLDGSIIVDITASNAKLRLRDWGVECPADVRTNAHATPDRNWHDSITTGVAIGQSDIGTVEVRPDTFRAAQGMLHVRGYINDRTQVIFDAIEPFEITPAWWAQLLVAILGAMTYAGYQLTRAVPQTAFSWGIGGPAVASVIAGGIAWALSDLNVLGVRADKGSLTGYFVLGLLTAYAGIDSVLRRLGKSGGKTSMSEEQSRAHPANDEEEGARS